ncbi:MAG: alpha/beta hydrolase [Betaproteobacteria bacterium]
MRLDVSGNPCYAYTGSRLLDAAQSTIVFVHGAANDHSVWALQSRYFAHHGFNVLAVDLPGHGRSGGPALTSVEAIADWVPQVLDAAGIAQAALVGHSFGSLATLACAARHADRVTKAVVLGPAAPMLVSDELLAAARADDHVAYEMINSWSLSAGKQLGGNTVPGIWMSGNALRLMERTPTGVLYTDLLACRSYADGVADAARIRCPVLAILGARDIMTPVKGAHPLLAAFADRRVMTLPDTGHSMMAEQPDTVLDALRAFL